MPTAANAGYYAEIVRERAILRRLVEAGTKVVQLGYGAAGGTGGDVDDVVDRAQAAVYEVVERRTSEDYIGLEAAMWQTYNEIEAIGNRGGELFGVPTGFRDLDELTNGLHAGQLIVVAGRPGLGKSTLGHGLPADRRRSSTRRRRCCSRWRWARARSRCGCCPPRRGSR